MTKIGKHQGPSPTTEFTVDTVIFVKLLQNDLFYVLKGCSQNSNRSTEILFVVK